MGSRPYSSLDSRNCNRCLYCCGLGILFIALLVISIAAGILGAYLYDHHIVFNSNNDSNDSSSHEHKHSDNGGGNLIFEDNFDTLDLSQWKHVITAAGGGNWEFEFYTNNRSNSYVRDGVLYIKPTLTNNTYTDTDFMTSGTLDLWGSVPGDVCTSNMDYGCERTGSATNPINAVQSARLRTAESFSFKYGTVEVRAQLPKGDWLWPAIWMLPKYNYYGQWPASGEIDIMEARGNYDLECTDTTFIDGTSLGVHQMGTSLHWGPYYGADMYNMTHTNQTLASPNLFSDDFHNFTMDWTPDGFTFSLDGTAYMTVDVTQFDGFWKYGKFDKTVPNSFNPWNDTTGNTTLNAPFDQEFFFVINLAAGGTSGFFPDGCTSNPDGDLPSYTKPWSDTSSTAYADFWNSVDSWYPTWYPFENNGESAALKIDYIRVYEYDSQK